MDEISTVVMVLCLVFIMCISILSFYTRCNMIENEKLRVELENLKIIPKEPVVKILTIFNETYSSVTKRTYVFSVSMKNITFQIYTITKNVNVSIGKLNSTTELKYMVDTILEQSENILCLSKVTWLIYTIQVIDTSTIALTVTSEPNTKAKVIVK